MPSHSSFNVILSGVHRDAGAMNGVEGSLVRSRKRFAQDPSTTEYSASLRIPSLRMTSFLVVLLLVILCGCTTDTIQPTGSIHLRFNYKGGRPSADSLFPVFPNPFDRANGDTTIAIQFALKDSGRATVLIQNVLGDAIAGYTDSTLSPGIYTGFWNPRGPDSTLVRSGLYFVTLHAGDFVNSRLVNIEENE